MKKRSVITLIIVLAVIVLAVIVLVKPHPDASEEFAKCVGENSILYVQKGCHACEYQENVFGDNYKYLTVVDCWVEREKCEGIAGTPTWFIKGEDYIGLKNIEQLKELTGC